MRKTRQSRSDRAEVLYGLQYAKITMYVNIEKRKGCEGRSKDIKDWNNSDIPIAVIHPASAGHGLNLQSGGSTLIWFGLTWSLELYQQTNARLYRQGQNDTVVIHHIIAKDTIDEDVMRALQLKEKTQSSLIDAVKARIGGDAYGG